MNQNEDSKALAAFKATVAAHIGPPSGLRFIAARYPYTYAADFLRSHHEMVPAWLRDRLDGSRSAASQIRSEWAKAIGVTDYDAAETLALAYIVENNVQNVPADLINRSADA